ncbi:MAG: ribonuclease III [Dehalococcoidia bacterium]
MKAATRPKRGQELQEALGVAFSDIGYLEQALVHRSYVNEALEEETETNERLEFLGDAVLGLTISHELYKRYPALSEGHLSQLRAMLVRWDTLAQVAEGLGLGDYLLLGRGEELSGGRQRPSNLACALEAVIGAAFLDGGLSKARKLILHLLNSELAKIAAGEIASDSKSQLQQMAQARWHQTPQYRLLAAEGPDHDKVFTVEVLVGSQALGRGQGRNKKRAELAAASEALEALSSAG